VSGLRSQSELAELDQVYGSSAAVIGRRDLRSMLYVLKTGVGRKLRIAGIDDFTAREMGAEMIVHYGHSCLSPFPVYHQVLILQGSQSRSPRRASRRSTSSSRSPSTSLTSPSPSVETSRPPEPPFTGPYLAMRRSSQEGRSRLPSIPTSKTKRKW